MVISSDFYFFSINYLTKEKGFKYLSTFCAIWWPIYFRRFYVIEADIEDFFLVFEEIFGRAPRGLVGGKHLVLPYKPVGR